MPLTPDGRIRSKDIGTGEVNSRVIDNLRSSNYDGDPESPDLDSGSQGWLILKNGKVVFNEGTFRGDVAIAGNLEVSGTDGILVFDGGDITVNSGGDIVINGGQLTAGPTTLNSAGVTISGSPVVLNSSGLDVGSGLTVIDSTGVQVGSDVVIDSTGLKIGGILQPAVEGITGGGTSQNDSLTTTYSTTVTFNLTVPSWASELYMMTVGRMQITTSSTQNLLLRITNDVGTTDDIETAEQTFSSSTGVLTLQNRSTITSPGTTVTVNFDARMNSGTNSSNFSSVGCLAIARRT